MASVNYKLISLSLERVDEMINKIPNAPIKLRNFIYSAGILTNKYNEYGNDLYIAINLIFKNTYNLVKVMLQSKNIYNYICTFIVQEYTNTLIGTMTMNDNIIGTITIFPEFCKNGIATNILTDIFNISKKINFPIHIYPNSQLESIIKKIGFIYFPTNDTSYAYNKYGKQTQVYRYVSTILDTKSDFMIVNKNDYNELFDLLGYNFQSYINLLSCCSLINIPDGENKEIFNNILKILSKGIES
jgi:hypothetical protein